MEKERLVNFVATIMEDSGFEVQKNYAISNQVIDIYGTLSTNAGDVGVVVACKNYEEPWKIQLDILKDMEVAAKAVHASKIIIFTTSSFSHSAAVYAQRRNIKLVDRKGLLKIAQNYSKKRNIVTEPGDQYEEEYYESDVEFYEPINSKPASLNPNSSTSKSSRDIFSGRFSRSNSGTSDYYRNNVSYNSRKTLSTRNVRNPVKFNVDLDGIFEFFKNHELIYMILLVLITSAITYLLNMITIGAYTGMGKIISCAIICYGGMLLINRNLSDILTKGSILFFISIIITILTLTM